MTWADFVAEMERKGVKPDTIIDYIDIAYTNELYVAVSRMDDGEHVQVI